MGRWRPPPPKSSPYITAKGFARLQDESKALWERRADVTKALAAAAAEGDRSENAEYIYRKKELRQIDRRIRYLQKRMPNLKVIKQIPVDQEHIYFGCMVTVATDDDKEKTYRIVGADEIQGTDTISVDSPLARLLLKKTYDDEVVVKTAKAVTRYVIVDIDYLQDE